MVTDPQVKEHPNIPMSIQRFLCSICPLFPSMRMASYRGAHRSDLINEEDGTPNYDANKYYPAYIGELICNKYCLISKASWGVNSTV